MSEHTPTPWRKDEYALSIYADNVPKGPMRVADLRGWGYLTGKGHGALGLSRDEGIAVQEANATFIVKAVNNHDALVKALEKISQQMTMGELIAEYGEDYLGDPEAGYDAIIMIAREALAKVSA
jgi:hypothetical protein